MHVDPAAQAVGPVYPAPPHWAHFAAEADSVVAVAAGAATEVADATGSETSSAASSLTAGAADAEAEAEAVAAGVVAEEAFVQPRLRESSYHQLRYIHPSKSVISMEEPASMMKLDTPVGVQS